MQSVPTQLGHYSIIAPLGAGGMGQVYLALDTRLNRQVAIKVLLGASAGEEANLRMLREARLVATIDHPNVCTIFEIGQAEAPYIVMQYIHGETLVDRMSRGGVTLAEVIDLARQVTSALAEAHSRGIVHRDIKPGNIMISSSGVVKVLDFGLAKSFLLHSSNDVTEVMLSSPGIVSGTVSYMSPEQLKAEPLDGRSDIFSLGVVLYEVASGKRPFDSTTIAATISAILTASPPPLESSEMAPLVTIIRRALEKRPERRYPTAEAMYDALGSLSRPRTRTTTRGTAASPKPATEPKKKGAETNSSRRRVKKAPAPDPEAEKLYLRGRAQWNKRHPDALRQAITLFHEAIEIDPMHANSHAGLADAYAILGVLQVVSPRDILPKARASALRAIELDPDLAEPHASLGYVAGIFDWDWTTAQRELREAMRLNPRYPWAPHWYGLLAMSKSLDDALEYVTRARDLDPLSPFLATGVGIIHHIRRENSAALRVYSQLLDAEVAFAPGHYYLGLTYEQMGRYEEATEHLRLAAAMGSRGSLFAGALGHLYAVSGKGELAREVLLGMAEEDQQRYVSPYNRLLIHIGLGNHEETLLWLERSLEDRSSWLWFMRADSRFDSIREDSACRELVARYGLEP